MLPARAMWVTLALLAAVPAPGRAQTTLDVVVVPRTGGNYIARVDPDGPRVLSLQTLTAAERDVAAGVSTSDGRFLVAATSEYQTQFPEPFNLWFLTIHDRVSGATARLPRGRDFPSFALHPRRTEILWSDSVGPLALGLGGQRRLAGCPSGSVGALAGNGSRVVYQCFSPTYHFIVVDVDTGALVADLGASPGAWPALNVDGTVVYDLDGGDVRSRSVATGTELGRAPLPGEGVGSVDVILVSPTTAEVYVIGFGVHVFDGSTLARVRAQIPAAARYFNWIFDPDRPRAYALGYSGVQPALWVLDSTTLQVVSSTLVPDLVASIVMRRVPTPAAPAQLAAAVQGASVTLTWTEGLPVAQTLRYVLEVGSAPGLNDIFSGLDVGLQTSFAASGVPPGTYYVRVRAGNYAGLGAPSNEVVVVVP
jgi:hypothetical protein